MTIHPRHDQVTRASIDISQAVVDAVKKHELTYAELVSLLAAALASWTKFEIRSERETDAAGTTCPNGCGPLIHGGGSSLICEACGLLRDMG